MSRVCLAVIFLISLTLSVLRIGRPSAAAAPAQEDASKAATRAVEAPRSVDEARGRARLLHETVHATLHYVHHAYFREDQGLKIPAATLEDVFKELESAHKVHLHWLAVNTRAMDIDHEAADDFEKAAVKAIAGGAEYHEAQEDHNYRFAGSITLASECLSCHLPGRSSNDPRAAALAIVIPLQQ
jgi:hypothetical protein